MMAAPEEMTIASAGELNQYAAMVAACAETVGQNGATFPARVEMTG